MVKIKEIKLLPSLWTLDVLYSKLIPEIEKVAFEYYEINHDYFGDKCINSVTKAWSFKDNQNRIIMFIDSKRPGLITHELVHVLWRFADSVYLEINIDTQEWQAQLHEYLFNEIVDKSNWSEV